MKRYLFIFLALITIGCSDDEQLNTTSTNSIDVYAAGTINGNACYWKNGINFMLNNNGFSTTYAEKIMVTNGNTYILGGAPALNVDSNSPIPGAYLFWENGIVTNLGTRFSEPNYEVSRINDFFVDNNNDVYILGVLNTLSNPTTFDLVYWKNGVKTTIQSNTNGLNSSSINIINNDVYISYSDNSLNGLNGVFVNGAFNAVSSNYGVFGVETNNNEMYIYGALPYTSNGYYYNFNSGLEIISQYQISNLDFDQNNIYTLPIRTGSDLLRNIEENGTPYYQAPLDFVIEDFNVYNNVLYVIERNLNGSQTTLHVNNSPIITLSNPSTPDDNFINDMFIYQN